MFNQSGNYIQKDTPVIKNLIIFTALVYLAQLVIKHPSVTEMGASHYYKSDLFRPYQLITCMFLHAPNNPMHIFFNMFCLYSFGTLLERLWGPKKFLFFYLVCGVGAALAEQFFIPYLAQKFADNYQDPNGQVIPFDMLVEAYKNGYSSLGASGAIMGIMAAFAYLFPNTQFNIMLLPMPVKAKYLVAGYVLIDLFGGFSSIQGDNVGHFAHLGGALFGFLIVFIWNKTNKKTFY